jgi:hypothetical protein
MTANAGGSFIGGTQQDADFMTKLEYIIVEGQQCVNESPLNSPSAVSASSPDPKKAHHKAKASSIRKKKYPKRSKDSKKSVKNKTPGVSLLPFEMLCSMYHIEQTEHRREQYQQVRDTNKLLRYWMYEEWCKLNDKAVVPEKFKTWSKNFEYEEGKQGVGNITYRDISAYADLTLDEYQSLTSTGKAAGEKASKIRSGEADQQQSKYRKSVQQKSPLVEDVLEGDY